MHESEALELCTRAVVRRFPAGKLKRLTIGDMLKLVKGEAGTRGIDAVDYGSERYTHRLSQIPPQTYRRWLTEMPHLGVRVEQPYKGRTYWVVFLGG